MRGKSSRSRNNRHGSMSIPRLINAYILCGGQSRRMGQSKSNMIHQGHSFVDHIARQIRSLFQEVYAVGKEGQQLHSSCPVLFDGTIEHHPLWGVARAMNHSEYDHVFIIPCDLIQITRLGTLSLLEHSWPCFATSEQNSQPLLGIYPCDWLHQTVSDAKTGQSVYKWSKSAHRCMVSPSNLTNINHPWEYP